MPDFQSLRGASRIFALGFTQWLNLPFDLDEDPETLEHKLTVLQSLGGQVQTQPGVPASRLRLLMRAMDTATRKKWKLFFDRILATGQNIEVVRDTGRYFWLAGDSARDLEAGEPPIVGSQYTLVTPDSASIAAGCIAVDLADPSGASRTNLISNGDMIDSSSGVPTGWVNDTPTTLGMIRSTYLRPNGSTGAVIEFFSKASGTKTAHINVQLGGLAANALNAGDDAYFSGMWRADTIPGASIAPVSAAIVMSDASTVTIGSVAGNPPINWTRIRSFLDFAAITATDTTVKLQLDFLDDLAYAPVYFTELQMEARKHGSAFIPYSTVRTSLTGSRASADVLKYLNGLAYGYQVPSLTDAVQWGFTVGLSFQTHWSNANIPTTAVWLYGDGDTDDVGTVQALVIKMTSTTVTATVTLSDGSTVVVTGSHGTRMVASVLDGDGTTDSGHIALYIDGTLADSDDFDIPTARQGKYFWIGSKPDGTATAAGDFSDVVLAPVYIDGTTVTIDEFAAGNRPDRNSWRCYLDPAQKGRSDRVQDNQVHLDVMLIESVRTT